jgi:hypothetical protein
LRGSIEYNHLFRIPEVANKPVLSALASQHFNARSGDTQAWFRLTAVLRTPTIAFSTIAPNQRLQMHIVHLLLP